LKVVFSPDAREYVRSEAAYLRTRSTRAAQQFSESLKRLRQDLGRFPEMGHATEEIPVPEVRRFVLGAYLVDYEVRAKSVVVLAVRHGRERPPSVELEADFDYENPDEDPRFSRR
jgi:plasmid stabilization system protein ParE